MAPPSGGGDNQQFCLRWNNYQSNLTNVFDELLQSESFVDVTLSCEGHSIKAHKMVLSACSPYFQALFYDNPCQHPIIIMRDVSWSDLKALVEFMYKGEINVCQDQINPLLKVAETLKIRGLAEVSAGRGDGGASAHPMSVYDDEDEEEEMASATAILRQDDDPDPEEEMKAKRPRLLAEGALDLNQRQRKRSRDGSYATPSPSLQGGESEISERGSSATPGQNQSQPLAMTTSTIVRNPFASPNPQTLEGRNSSVAGNQRNSPPPQGHSNGNHSGASMHSHLEAAASPPSPLCHPTWPPPWQPPPIMPPLCPLPRQPTCIIMLPPPQPSNWPPSISWPTHMRWPVLWPPQLQRVGDQGEEQEGQDLEEDREPVLRPAEQEPREAPPPRQWDPITMTWKSNPKLLK
nr:protein bric-a-brac 2-like [Drosophila takahashii]